MSPEELLADNGFLAWYFKTDLAQVRKWEQRKAEDPSLQAAMNEAVKLLEVLSASEATPSDMQLTEARKSLMARINTWEQRNSATPGNENLFRFWASAAAGIAVVALSAWFWFRTAGNGELRYRTDANESRRIELPDGSVVNLNSGSEIRVSPFEHTEKDREVWLDGEAYFEVKHLADHRKFLVHSDGLEVEVLGTQFNVRKQEGHTEVVLESGKVVLSASGTADKRGKVVMRPGELVEFTRTSGTFKKREVNPRLYTAWTEGKVVFENATLPEVVTILTDRYGLEVEVENGSELGHFNGVFPAHDPEVVLKALEKTYQSQIEVRDQKVTIRK